MLRQFSALIAVIGGLVFWPALGLCSASGGNEARTGGVAEGTVKHCPARKAVTKVHPGSMEDDRRRYEKWCKMHPGHCSKKLKMF